MLSQEAARVELAKVRDAERGKRRLAQLSRPLVPDDQRALATILELAGKPFGGTRSAEHVDAVEQAVRRLDALPHPRLARLFARAHPHLGDELAAMWTMMRPGPYAMGGRPFRAPREPSLTALRRVFTLHQVLQSTSAYDQPIEWFAAWAGYLWEPAHLGRLLAASVDLGRADVLDILCATATGEHPIGRPAMHLPIALVCCGEPRAWESAVHLLETAEREEGLRQSVIETADLGHPEAFRRIVAAVIDSGLTRFSSVVRGVAVWLGIGLEASDRELVDWAVGQLSRLLSDPAEVDDALRSESGRRVYLALWALARTDVDLAVERGAPLLRSDNADVRLATVSLFSLLGLSRIALAMSFAVHDPDPRVATAAFSALYTCGFPVGTLDESALDSLVELARRLDRPREVVLDLWLPRPSTVDRSKIGGLITSKTPPDLLHVARRAVPFLAGTERAWYVNRLADDPAAHRQELVDFLRDRSSYIRGRALNALASLEPLPPDVIAPLEALLATKRAELRSGVLVLLLRQDAQSVRASAARLLAGETADLRDAGEELLRAIGSRTDSAGSEPGRVGRLLSRLGRRERSPAAEPPVAEPSVAEPSVAELSAAAPAGLVDDLRRTPAIKPTARIDLTPYQRGMALVLSSLEAWLDEHSDVELAQRSGNRVLLGDIEGWWFWDSYGLDHTEADDGGRHALHDIVDRWWSRTSGQLTDGGVEAALLHMLLGVVPTGEMTERRTRAYAPWFQDILDRALRGVDVPMRRIGLVRAVIGFVVTREARHEWIAPQIDLVESVLGAVPSSALRELPSVAALLGVDGSSRPWHATQKRGDWRRPIGQLLLPLLSLEARHRELFATGDYQRVWALLRFLDEPRGRFDPRSGHFDEIPTALSVARGIPARVPRQPVRRRPPLEFAVHAAAAGAASDDDLLDLLLGVDVVHETGLYGWERPLAEATRRRAPAALRSYGPFPELVDRVRAYVLDRELTRGELPVETTAATTQIRSVYGAPTAVRLLAALGRDRLTRSSGTPRVKADSLSRLLRVSFPDLDDTPETFAEVATSVGVSETRLLELAMYAPQWAPMIESAIGWTGLADAVGWLHAHTKDDRWNVDSDVREEWVAEIARLTPLTARELTDGAVDVDWFRRTLSALGDRRFDQVLKIAKYASGGGGHTRAQLFGRALRGSLDVEAIVERARAKRHQDSVRAIGLAPLPPDDPERSAELLRRYEFLAGFVASDRTSGAARRSSETLAVRVGMDNLARTAGYPDPQRLQWAMEAIAVADVVANPPRLSEGEYEIELTIDEGVPAVVTRKSGKELKAVPAALRKHPDVMSIKKRVTDLREQARRMRRSLEQSSVNGELITPDELSELLRHPILAPLLVRTVLVQDDGGLGFAVLDGGLRRPDGVVVPLTGDGVRIAHPADLLRSGEWPALQHSIFSAKIVQPFKQVFRELYTLTDAEVAGVLASARYAGHQVRSNQAYALLDRRGWVRDHDMGALSRTFHAQALTASLYLADARFTPGEVEDVTIDDIVFSRRDDQAPVRLDEVPERIFSETMRDVDLVVSVAHAFGVDPEASRSTVEARAALVTETCRLLGLDNVTVDDHHVLITGRIGSYSVHLGSGVVHRRPGNAVCIVPVSGQHRGRVFLPFADDDPRSAEVISKVIMLARDDKIRDPTVLEQLR